MSIKARAEHDFRRDSVRVLIGETEPGTDEVVTLYTFRGEGTTTVDAFARPDDDSGLLLREDIARAVYEALADHFGHSGHDTRALRRDYEDERKRVDTFIAHLTRQRRA